MKGVKTTVVAYIVLALGVALTVGLVMGKIDKGTYGVALGAIGAFGATIIGFLSKDYDQTHSKDENRIASDNSNPDNPDGYPDKPS